MNLYYIVFESFSGHITPIPVCAYCESEAQGKALEIIRRLYPLNCWDREDIAETMLIHSLLESPQFN